VSFAGADLVGEWQVIMNDQISTSSTGERVITVQSSMAVGELSPNNTPIVDGGALRTAMRQFATGVAIITTEWKSELYGMTVNSLTSVSLDPPLISVCFIPEARTAKSVISRRRFNVHVLAATGKDLCGTFAKAGGDRYAETKYNLDEAGIPVLEEAVAVFQCDVASTVVAGDHTIVFGLVRGVIETPEFTGKQPLIFWNGLLTEPHVAENDAPPKKIEQWELHEWESNGLMW